MAAIGADPYFAEARRLPAEDALALTGRKEARSQGKPLIVVLAYPHISNFDDLDPLRLEPEVDLAFTMPASLSPAKRGWRSCRVQRPRFQTWRLFVQRAGISTLKRICGVAAAFSAFAAATRCSGGASPTPKEPKEGRGRWMGSAFSIARRFSMGQDASRGERTLRGARRALPGV